MEIESLEKSNIIYLSKEKIDDFTVGIENGYLMWKVKLLDDNNIYQIKYIIEQYITPKGNKSKRKVYYIWKNDKKLIFNDEVKKWFYSFRRPYLVEGI